MKKLILLVVLLTTGCGATPHPNLYRNGGEITITQGPGRCWATDDQRSLKCQQ